jgi:uncharacterized membrane protein
LEQLISFLFKYRTALYSKSQFGFGVRPHWLILLAAVVGLLALLYFIYVRFSVQLPTEWRLGLMALRTALVVLIVFCIMRPIIVVPAVLPQSSYVLVLMDDSSSMKLAGESEQTRLETVKSLMGADSQFNKQLSDKFKIRTYKFSNTAERADASGLAGEGEQTNLTSAIEQAVRDAAGLPVSGIVVMSDGASNAEADAVNNLSNTLNNLKARNLPVFAVGVGPTKIEGDIEVIRATAPRRVIAGSSITAEVLLKASGEGQKVVQVDLMEDGHPLRSQPVTLQGEATSVAKINFKPLTPGVHRYALAVKPADGEPIVDNNAAEIVVEVEDAHPKILYIEGEPRWEYGKIRTAFTEEKNMSLVSILRSADGKYYRQGVENADELVQGFPKSEEELFKYDAIVFGSIEATFFTFDQLRAVEQFVSRRGGTLLVLGGAKALLQGGYGNTPIADLLPVFMRGETTQDSQTFKAQLTTRGKEHQAVQLAEQAEANAKAWEQMPAITLPEVATEIKPGATVLLEAKNVTGGRVVPLLIEERYGRGRSLAFLASDTWRWRMMLDSKNKSFEAFWLNLSRYLVESVRHRVEAFAERGFYNAREEVKVKVEVGDEKYLNVSGAQVVAKIITPSGASIEVPVKPSNDAGFEGYVGSFVPEEEGLYKVETSARRGDKSQAQLGTAQASFMVGKINREAYDAAQNRELLKRVAADTGGNYYTPAETKNLLEDLTHRESDSSVRVTYDLWDMPFNFLLAVALAAAEWFIRKRKGLA